MQKKKFEIFTKDDYKFIHQDVVIIKNKGGWVFLYITDGQTYTNATQDGANCPAEENEKWLKKISNTIKNQIKLVKETGKK